MKNLRFQMLITLLIYVKNIFNINIFGIRIMFQSYQSTLRRYPHCVRKKVNIYLEITSKQNTEKEFNMKTIAFNLKNFMG